MVREVSLPQPHFQATPSTDRRYKSTKSSAASASTSRIPVSSSSKRAIPGPFSSTRRRNILGERTDENVPPTSSASGPNFKAPLRPTFKTTVIPQQPSSPASSAMSPGVNDSMLPRPGSTPSAGRQSLGMYTMRFNLNEDETQLLDMREPEMFGITSPVSSEADVWDHRKSRNVGQGVLGAGRMMTPANSQETMPSQSTAPSTIRPFSRLPTPPSSQSLEDDEPIPTTLKKVRPRPSPTPPRRLSRDLANETPTADPSPNPRRKKSPRIDLVMSQNSPIRSRAQSATPRATSSGPSVQSTQALSRSTKGKSRASVAPLPTTPIYARQSSQAITERVIPATAPVRKARQSTAPAVRVAPKTVARPRAKPRKSRSAIAPATVTVLRTARKSMTTAELSNMTGKKIGFLDRPLVPSDPEDDPLLLKALDDDQFWEKITRSQKRKAGRKSEMPMRSKANMGVEARARARSHSLVTTRPIAAIEAGSSLQPATSTTTLTANSIPIEWERITYPSLANTREQEPIEPIEPVQLDENAIPPQEQIEEMQYDPPPAWASDDDTDREDMREGETTFSGGMDDTFVHILAKRNIEAGPSRSKTRSPIPEVEEGGAVCDDMMIPPSPQSLTAKDLDQHVEGASSYQPGQEDLSADVTEEAISGEWDVSVSTSASNADMSQDSDITQPMESGEWDTSITLDKDLAGVQQGDDTVQDAETRASEISSTIRNELDSVHQEDDIVQGSGAQESDSTNDINHELSLVQHQNAPQEDEPDEGDSPTDESMESLEDLSDSICPTSAALPSEVAGMTSLNAADLEFQEPNEIVDYSDDESEVNPASSPAHENDTIFSNLSNRYIPTPPRRFSTQDRAKNAVLATSALAISHKPPSSLIAQVEDTSSDISHDGDTTQEAIAEELNISIESPPVVLEDHYSPHDSGSPVPVEDDIDFRRDDSPVVLSPEKKMETAVSSPVMSLAAPAVNDASADDVTGEEGNAGIEETDLKVENDDLAEQRSSFTRLSTRETPSPPRSSIALVADDAQVNMVAHTEGIDVEAEEDYSAEQALSSTQPPVQECSHSLSPSPVLTAVDGRSGDPREQIPGLALDPASPSSSPMPATTSHEPSIKNTDTIETLKPIESPIILRSSLVATPKPVFKLLRLLEEEDDDHSDDHQTSLDQPAIVVRAQSPDLPLVSNCPSIHGNDHHSKGSEATMETEEADVTVEAEAQDWESSRDDILDVQQEDFVCADELTAENSTESSKHVLSDQRPILEPRVAVEETKMISEELRDRDTEMSQPEDQDVPGVSSVEEGIVLGEELEEQQNDCEFPHLFEEMPQDGTSKTKPAFESEPVESFVSQIPIQQELRSLSPARDGPGFESIDQESLAQVNEQSSSEDRASTLKKSSRITLKVVERGIIKLEAAKEGEENQLDTSVSASSTFQLGHAVGPDDAEDSEVQGNALQLETVVGPRDQHDGTPLESTAVSGVDNHPNPPTVTVSNMTRAASVHRFANAGSTAGISSLEAMLHRRQSASSSTFSNTSARVPCQLAQQVTGSSSVSSTWRVVENTKTGTTESIQIRDRSYSRSRRSLGEEIASAVATDEDEGNESFKSVVEVSSLDPRAAARAAAILKLNHKYIEHGVLPTTPSAISTPLPTTSPARTPKHTRRKSKAFESGHFSTLESARKLNREELLYEAELEIVASRRSRSRSRARSLGPSTDGEGWESDETELAVPGGWKVTPGKRKRRTFPAAASASDEPRDLLNDTQAVDGTNKAEGKEVDRPWGVPEWKRLERIYRAEKEKWIQEREVKALPVTSSVGLFGWAKKALSGPKEDLKAREWSLERVVDSFVDAEKCQQWGGEWDRKMITLRVKALEKRVNRHPKERAPEEGNYSKKSRTTEPESYQRPGKAIATPSRRHAGEGDGEGDSTIVSIVPPTTIRRMLGSFWSTKPKQSERIEEDNAENVEDEPVKAVQTGKKVENKLLNRLKAVQKVSGLVGPGPSSTSSISTERSVEPSSSSKETGQEGEISTPMKQTTVCEPISIPHPSSPNWRVPAQPIQPVSASSVTQRGTSNAMSASIPTLSGPNQSEAIPYKSLYPPLNPPYTQRSTAIQALFDTPSSNSSLTRSTSIPSKLGGGGGNGSPSVSALVKSFEAEGLLSKSLEGKNKGMDGLWRVQSRGA